MFHEHTQNEIEKCFDCVFFVLMPHFLRKIMVGKFFSTIFHEIQKNVSLKPFMLKKRVLDSVKHFDQTNEVQFYKIEFSFLVTCIFYQ